MGGFTASDWLYKKISEALKELFALIPCVRTVKLHCTFDTSSTNFFISNKAVADSAISYYIDHFVQTRVSKLTYGCKGSIEYDSSLDLISNMYSTFVMWLVIYQVRAIY